MQRQLHDLGKYPTVEVRAIENSRAHGGANWGKGQRPVKSQPGAERRRSVALGSLSVACQALKGRHNHTRLRRKCFSAAIQASWDVPDRRRQSFRRLEWSGVMGQRGRSVTERAKALRSGWPAGVFSSIKATLVRKFCSASPHFSTCIFRNQ